MHAQCVECIGKLSRLLDELPEWALERERMEAELADMLEVEAECFVLMGLAA